MPHTWKWLEVAEVRFYQLFAGLPPRGYLRFHIDHHNFLVTKKDPEYLMRIIQTNRTIKILSAVFYIFGVQLYFVRLLFDKSADSLLKKRLIGDYAFNIAWWICLVVLSANGYFHEVLTLYLIPLLIGNPFGYLIHIARHMYSDPKKEKLKSTLMRPNKLFDFFTLNASYYHRGHHWAPQVPWYNLPKLRSLDVKKNEREISYSTLLWHWFVKNAQPYTIWKLD